MWKNSTYKDATITSPTFDSTIYLGNFQQQQKIHIMYIVFEDIGSFREQK